MKLKLPYAAKLLKSADQNKSELFLTGGSLRDLILGKENTDYDIAVLGNPDSVSRSFSSLIDASWIALDTRREIFRVSKEKFIFDFTKIKKDIYSDLKRRDFRINSLGYNVKENKFYDPLGGSCDIKRKIIQADSRKTFSDDPLRLIRAYRLASQLDFKIEDKTKKTIKKDAGLIEKVKPERIRTELMYILRSPHSFKFIKELASVGIFKSIFKSKKHNFILLKKLEKFEEKILFFRKDPLINNWLNKEISASSDSCAILKLFILLQSFCMSSRKKIELIYKRLKLSNKEKRLLLILCNYEKFEKDLPRLFESIGADMPGIILLCSLGSTKFNFKYEVERFEKYGKLESKFNRLISGKDVLKILKIKPGPRVGRILKEIKVKFLRGQLKNKAQILERIPALSKKD